MFERFTDRARSVVNDARTEAKALQHAHIGTEHLLLAMLTADGGIAHQVLIDAGLDAPGVRADIERLVTAAPRLLSDEDAAALRTIGIDLDAVLARIEESFGPDALEPPPPPRRRGLLGRRKHHSRFTPRSKKVLELSLREATAARAQVHRHRTPPARADPGGRRAGGPDHHPAWRQARRPAPGHPDRARQSGLTLLTRASLNAALSRLRASRRSAGPPTASGRHLPGHDREDVAQSGKNGGRFVNGQAIRTPAGRQPSGLAVSCRRPVGSETA